MNKYKFLLILRSFLYPLVEGTGPASSQLRQYLLKKYWIFFWWLEWRLEHLELGQKGSKVFGSERAVLIEQILLGQKSAKILEIGTGFGQNLAILCSLVADENLYAIDLKPERIEATKDFLNQSNINKVTLEVADAQSLPYADQTFDVVFASAVFLYLTKTQAKKALAEMLRVTKSRIVLLEQHVPQLEEQRLSGGVTEDFYYLRDYRMLIESINQGLSIQEIPILNPRWEVENWKEWGRVFVVDSSAKDIHSQWKNEKKR